MPELPEVETVVRTLENQLGDFVIEDVEVIYSNILANKNVEEFCGCLKNQKIEKYDRKGKFLIFTLTDYVMIAHLRMEGKFFVYRNNEKPNKHTHIVFKLSNGYLHYNDVRKFGRFWVYKKGENLECLNKLGYEPFDEDLTADKLIAYNKNNRTAIKTQLLDQSMIAGIGNIYADEICYYAGLNPLREARYVSYEKWEKIIEGTRIILSKAIQAGGTTIRSYTSSLGVTGLFQLSLNVHSREKEKCYQCNEEIIKIRVNGRGTYYCPNCQKEKAITIAITGSIGSGKSALSKYLLSKGYKVASCDDINRQLLESDKVKKDLSAILNIDWKDFSKKAMAEIIFNNKEIKDKAEEYLHTIIKREIFDWIKENDSEKFLFVEVPLLFEVNWDKFFDYNVDVYSNQDNLIKRLKENRNMSEKEIADRLKNQLDVEVKKEKSDYVVENNASLKVFNENIERFLSDLNK